MFCVFVYSNMSLSDFPLGTFCLWAARSCYLDHPKLPRPGKISSGLRKPLLQFGFIICKLGRLIYEYESQPFPLVLFIVSVGFRVHQFDIGSVLVVCR